MDILEEVDDIKIKFLKLYLNINIRTYNIIDKEEPTCVYDINNSFRKLNELKKYYEYFFNSIEKLYVIYAEDYRENRIEILNYNLKIIKSLYYNLEKKVIILERKILNID